MIDPRGGYITESEHTVKTLIGAREWFDLVMEEHLPITVNQYKTSNGRVAIKVYSTDGTLIHKRG